MFTKEDYVSLETAKKLKEKGFDEYCGAYYHLNCDDMTEDECFEVATDNDFKNSNNVYRVGAPTLYEAQKWLLEKYDLYLYPAPYLSKDKDEASWFFVEIHYRCTNEWDYSDFIDATFVSYQQALDAGIQEALKRI